MRTYAIAITTAALFAIPTSALSQGVDVRGASEWTLAVITATRADPPMEANVGNCGKRACIRCLGRSA
jgi:hypothetical protein